MLNAKFNVYDFVYFITLQLVTAHFTARESDGSIVSASLLSFFSIIAKFFFSGIGKESFNPILDPDADPDRHQNLTISI